MKPNPPPEKKIQPSPPERKKQPSPPLKLPEILNYNFDNPRIEKKWNKRNVDITDYFNYGLNEETFKAYANKVKKLFSKLGSNYQPKNPEDPKDRNAVLDSTFSLSNGGFGEIDINAIREYIKDGSYLMYDPMVSMEWLNDPQSSSENIKNEIVAQQQDIPDIYSSSGWTNPQPTPSKPISKPEPPPKNPFNSVPTQMPRSLPHLPPQNPDMMGRMPFVQQGPYPRPPFMGNRMMMPPPMMQRMQPPSGSHWPIPHTSMDGNPDMNIAMRQGAGIGGEKHPYPEYGEEPYKK